MHANLYNQFQSPYVRDLVWSLTSPDLLDIPQYPSLSATPCFAEFIEQNLDQWRALDRDDQPLRQYLQQFSNQRLGLYFERLWHFWLQQNPRFELLAHNVPLRNQQRTIGELDVVVLDRETQAVEHWELTVKFYLQVAVGVEQALYFGPGLKDRLDRKLGHLLDHQLPLGLSDEARRVLSALAEPIDCQRLISKGRIFYPVSSALNPAPELHHDHLRGVWFPLAQFAEHCDAANHEFSILNKQHWLGRCPPEILSYEETLIQLQQPQQYLPCQLLQQSNTHQQRLFVVPNNFTPRL